MPNVSQIIKLHQQQRDSELRRPWIRLGLISGILISLLLVVITMAGLVYTIYLTHDLPSVDTLVSYLEPPNGTLLLPTRLYDRTHEHIILTLENPAAAGKQYLHIGKEGQEGVDQFSEYLVEATITELDPNFWKHRGYTLSGISEGTHPTLAQLLITNLVLADEPPTLRRNIRERLLAAQVTAKYGREKILEWYLNSAQYGDLIYGADAAARVYFGKSALKLTLAEAALLTAMAEAPWMDLRTGTQILKQQQELIIQKMLLDGYVSGDETRQALKESIMLLSQKDPQSISATFTKLVLMQISSAIPVERLYRGGLEIITTLDYRLQLQADCASRAQLARISGRDSPTIAFDGSPCEADLLLPTIESSPEKSLQELKAEVVILDPHSGQILAMTGNEANAAIPAYSTTHPAGSILSPFLYITAFTHGMSPATLLWDIPGSYVSEEISPIQSDQIQGLATSYHGPVSLRKAFANDYTSAAVEVLQQLGIENVWLTEQQFGIRLSEINRNSRDILEEFYTQQISLLESVDAYSVLANQGVMEGQPETMNTPVTAKNGLSSRGVLRVVSVNGQVWLDWTEPVSLPVVTSQIAYLINNVMSDEKARWPMLGHPNALEIGRPAGAKVSLNSEMNAAWAVGYIPQLAIGVWMGRSHGEAGGITVDMPAGIWHALMQYASSQMPVQDFAPPTGISRVLVCDPSGMLVSPLCPNTVEEVFLEGNEPTMVDDLFQEFYINRETGTLATIFTPPELVDEQVYLVVPAKALTWAKETGLPLPPEIYDSISTPPPALAKVQFSKPDMFDHVSTLVRFYGSAGGDDFSYYRLQAGKGLNPREWLQIGDDVAFPVNDELLGTWDISGLEGVYEVELLVVRQDLRVERAILQLTIDNTSPQVQIQAPKEDELFTSLHGDIILMNASVSDSLGVQRVEYYVDNKLVSTLFEPPFIIPWDVQLGEHTLRVEAYDLAGNQTTTNVSFSVIR